MTRMMMVVAAILATSAVASAQGQCGMTPAGANGPAFAAYDRWCNEEYGGRRVIGTWLGGHFHWNVGKRVHGECVFYTYCVRPDGSVVDVKYPKGN